jgi:hypothetical protein
MRLSPTLVLTILASTPLLAQNPTPAPVDVPVTTAVLSDGTRLDVKAGTEVGSFLVQTEYGILLSQGEQVTLIVDGQPEVRILEPLRELDYPAWVARLVERGHINRLYADTPPPEHEVVLLDALRIWGQRLDSLSPKAKRDNRVETLWKQLVKTTNPNQVALLVGALEEAISPLQGSDRRISVSKWRKIMKGQDSARRWAAARIAAVLDDASTELDLLDLSLNDKKLWVALEAGRALDLIDERGAIYRWSYEMVRKNPRMVKNRSALLLAAWSRHDPKNAKEMASRVRSGGLFRTNPYPPVYQPTTDRQRPFNDDGREGTFHSALVIGVPSRLLMLKVADVIEQVGEASEMELPAIEPLPEGATAADFEKAQGEAWRKVFMER